MGNFHSVARALRAAAPGVDVAVCRNPKDIENAARVVFPGQGAMPDCMKTLNASGLRDAVLHAARTKPLLGVCVGEQMLFGQSEEGDTACLGVFEGTVKRFSGPAYANTANDTADNTRNDTANDTATDTERLKVPHMGWNRVTQTNPHALWDGIPDNTFFYFVHSYYAAPADARLTVGETHYGKRFTSAVAQANIFAVQFHPEKSAGHGLQLYRNFITWNP